MSLQNLFRTNTYILLFILFSGCKRNDTLFVNELKCKSSNDIKSVVDSFSSYLSKNDGFFSITENGDSFFIEPKKSDYSYRDRNIKLSYVYDRNLLLINEEVKDLTDLSSIVSGILTKHLADQGFQISKNDIEKFSRENSGLIFEISEHSENDNEISQKQSYSILLILKHLNCSIDEIRKNLSEKIFNKELQSCTEKEKELIRNMMPKIFYVFYFKNYKISVPVPTKN